MDVQGKVIDSIAKILKDRGEIKDSETVTVDLRLDEIESLIRTEAVMAIEVAFNLGYTPQCEIDKMRTVQDVVNYVQRITGPEPPRVCNCGRASMVTANHDPGCALRTCEKTP